ncbi:hypothetical protein ABIE19_000632 [Brevundimonas faecalis]|uniref:DUF6980 domain-containing protein n=1 Tax=Brevundimonas faecalis TaxID=947378 RepID=A0ABV2R9N8_9CAUL
MLPSGLKSWINNDMEDDSDHLTSHMAAHPQNDWGSVRYDARFDLYWLSAGDARQQLFYCPWCGVQLPPSQRDRWFDELEARGIDPNIDPIPEEFQSGAWRGVAKGNPPSRQRGAIAGRYIEFFDIPLDDESAD